MLKVRNVYWKGHAHTYIHIMITLLITNSGICKCAEIFPSSSDLKESTHGIFDPYILQGETRVFPGMSFHCEGTITKIKYKIDSLQCRCHGNECSEGSGKYGTLPQLQLWRKNGTIYYLEENINLTDGSSEQTIQWKFQDEDVIGIWVPSSINECSCVSEKISKVGFFYGKSSRNYHLDGYHEVFNTSYYKLEDGPMPMITVETG